MDKTRHALSPLFSNRTTGYYIFKVTKITIFYQVKNLKTFYIISKLHVNRHVWLSHNYISSNEFGLLFYFARKPQFSQL